MTGPNDTALNTLPPGPFPFPKGPGVGYLGQGLRARIHTPPAYGNRGRYAIIAVQRQVAHVQENGGDGPLFVQDEAHRTHPHGETAATGT